MNPNNPIIDRLTRPLARELHRLKRDNRRTARASQAAFRSVEVTDGPVTYYDEDGEPVLEVGQQPDGGVTVVQYDAETPPTCTEPDVASYPGANVVTWDGTFEDVAAPSTLAYAEIHASPSPDYFADDTTQIGTFASLSGGSFTHTTSAGQGVWYYSLQAVSRSGAEGDKSAEVASQALDGNAATDPPTESPVIEALGTADQIIVTATSLDAISTEVSLHMSTEEGFIYDESNRVTGTPTRGLVIPVAAQPDGSPLVADTIYYFRAVAVNNAGFADEPSPEVSASLDPDRVSSLVLALLEAGNVRAGRIDIGPGYWDPDEGIVVPQSDEQVTRISADPNVPSTWAGKVIGTFVTLMAGIVTGLLDVLGTMQFSKGVSAPRTAPDVTETWDCVPLVYVGASERFGLTDSEDGANWVTLNLSEKRVEFYSKTTGALVSSFSVGVPVTGLARVGALYYVMVNDPGFSSAIVRVYDAVGNLVGDWNSGVSALFSPILGGTTTNTLLVGYSTGSRTARIRRHDTNGMVSGGPWVVDMDSNAPLGGLWGDTYLHVARVFGEDARAFTYGSARTTSQEFPRGNGNPIRGLWYSSGTFHTLNPSVEVFTYGTNQSTDQVVVGNTWASADGIRETQVGELVTVQRRPRTNLMVMVNPAPELGQAGSNKATRTGIYAGSTVAVLRRHSILAAGVNSVIVRSLPAGPTPPATNGFADIASTGRARSEAVDANGLPVWELKGSGDWRMGPFSGGPSGSYDPVHVVGAAGEVAFEAGWSGTAKFRKTPDGTELRVVIDANAPGANNSTIFMLPASHRPVSPILSTFVGNDGSLPTSTVNVGTDGGVRFFTQGSSGVTRVTGSVVVPLDM